MRQHSKHLSVSRSVISGDPNADRSWLPMAYGGSDFFETFDSFGGIAMAATEYAKILAAFSLGENNPLLTPAYVDKMWTLLDKPNMVGMTRGWTSYNGGFNKGHRVPGHSGQIADVNSYVQYSEQSKISVVLFLNGNDPGDDGKLYSPAQDLYINVIQYLDASKKLPTTDLFPSVGMNPLPQPK